MRKVTRITMSVRMNFLRRFAVLAGCGLLLFSLEVPAACSAEGDDKEKTVPAVTEAAAAITDQTKWLEGLAAGYRHAQTNQLPIIVRVGGESCQPCVQLDQEIAKPAVQQELKQWTPVYIDVDKSPADARLMAVGPIPALRILTSQGKVVASREGIMTAEEFVNWLQENREAAVAAIAAELTRTGPPSLVDVIRLTRQFQNRDAAVREAALRRLTPYPHTAASAIVSGMTEGNLSTRLTALELLQQWQAPVEGLDPWRPETITDERIDQLSAWASALQPNEQPDADKSTELPRFSEEELSIARETIDKMIEGDASGARAMRERLARFGEALLPDVYERLKTAQTDNARRRLTALRYRLVAADELVLNWPGGLESLAATDEATRLAAADELSRRAKLQDEALLLELFSDPSPLIREISLRALQDAGGENTQQTLIRLLDDPEPNVRAAVLKQLTEVPTQDLVPQIAKYVAAEENADLVVHAVRFLREAGGKEAIACLKTLNADPSWQVRAEAAEAIGDIAKNERGITTAQKAQAYRVLIEMLKDEDSFVVSRAVKGLMAAELVAAVEPMIQVAQSHPDLSHDVITMLASNHKNHGLVISHLRKFSDHELAKVRAAAIEGLVLQESELIGAELNEALADSEREVRIAAAEALFQWFVRIDARERDAAMFSGVDVDTIGVDVDVDEWEVIDEPVPGFLGQLLGGLFGGENRTSPDQVPKNDQIATEEAEEETPVAEPEGEESDLPESIDGLKEDVVTESEGANQRDLDKSSDPDAKLRAIRAGQQLPPWTFELAAPLLNMLNSESDAERLAAALPLAAIGRDTQTVPVLRELATAHPENVSQIAAALPWLLWEDRRELFGALVPAAKDAAELGTMANLIAQTDNPRNAELLWSLINHDAATAETLAAVANPIRELHFPENSYDPTEAPAVRRKGVIESVLPRAKTGSRWQRVMALALLMPIARDDIAELARSIVDDPQSEAGLRADAFQIMMLTQTKAEAAQTALTGLSEADPEIQKRAIKLLAYGKEALAELYDGTFSLSYGNQFSSSRYNRSSGQIVIVEVPEALPPESVRPLLASPDPEIAAGAAYLLSLLGEDGAIERLIEIWRNQPQDKTRDMRRLVYRAIAHSNDDSHLEILEDLFQQIQADDADEGVGEFYWTVRGMTGPKVLGFRKRVRDDVGMENLR